MVDVDSDFFANEAVAFFSDGSSQAVAVVTVVNDNIPEGNETFVWRIVNTGVAQLGRRNSTEVIISASDQPHGELQFAMVTHACYMYIHLCHMCGTCM